MDIIITYEWWINLMVMKYLIGLYVIRKMVIRVQMVVWMDKQNIQVLWKYQMSIYVELLNNGYRYCSYACVWGVDFFRSVLFPIKLHLKNVLIAPWSFKKEYRIFLEILRLMHARIRVKCWNLKHTINHDYILI